MQLPQLFQSEEKLVEELKFSTNNLQVILHVYEMTTYSVTAELTSFKLSRHTNPHTIFQGIIVGLKNNISILEVAL